MSGLGKMFGAGDVETFLGWPKATVSELGGARIALFGADTATPNATVGAY